MQRDKARWQQYLLPFMGLPGGHRRSLLLLSARQGSYKLLSGFKGSRKASLVDGGVAKFWKGVWDWQ